MAADNEELAPIIVKKIKKGGGHHGGAWKVAYADFVTAMMAFFLLLWLLNVSTDEQKNAISNYFDPTNPKVSDTSSGAGGVLGGLAMAPQGAMTSTQQPIFNPQPSPKPKTVEGSRQYRGQNEKRDGDTQGPENDFQNEDMISPQESAQEMAIEKVKEEIRKQEEEEFEDIKSQIEQAIADNPDLAGLADNLLIDMTREGLRIQIVDQDGDPMFPSGSARMFEKTRRLLGKVTEIVQGIQNDVSIRGHTDASPYGPGSDYTNWNLSSDRANSSRQAMEEFGMPEQRIFNVIGKAATDPLITDNPLDPQNRRISIILMREEITNPQAFEDKAQKQVQDEAQINERSNALDAQKNEAEAQSQTDRQSEADEALPSTTVPSRIPGTPPIGTFRRTPGAVEFP